MRILQVTESFATGTMEVVRLVAEGAAREGHSVAIAYGERPDTPADLRERVAGEVELVALPWTRRTVGTQLNAMRALRGECRSRRPDVIHLHSSFAGLVGSFSAAAYAPTVFTPHGYSFLSAGSRPRRLAYRLAERLIARRVTMIGAVSQSEATLARELGARRVEVVPNGIPELDPGGSEGIALRGDDRPSVVAMGRLTPARRPAATARILAAVSDLAGVHWIGGGSSADVEAVRASGVEVTGMLERELAVARLARATVLLNWSAWDSHPLSVLEAMAFDVVAIGSDIEANRELLGPDQVCATEEEAIRLVRGLLEDAGLREELLEGQRRRRARFGSGRMVADWLGLYARLAQAGGKDPTATAQDGDGLRTTP